VSGTRVFRGTGRIPEGARWFHLDAACNQHSDPVIFATWLTFGQNVLIQPKGPRKTGAFGWVPSPEERAQIEAHTQGALTIAHMPPEDGDHAHGWELLKCPRPSCGHQVSIRWDTLWELHKMVRFLWGLGLDRIQVPGPDVLPYIDSFARFLWLVKACPGDFATVWRVMSAS
jgi:hypothetical protein